MLLRVHCRYAEAERRFTEAVAEARLGFPPGDPHIPSALHYLAELYRNTRRYEEAQPLYEEVRGDAACGDGWGGTKVDRGEGCCC
jgi:hypothetical protein